MIDPFLTVELGKCQAAFNKLHNKYKKLLDFVKEFANLSEPDFMTDADAKELLKEIGELEESKCQL